jgi:hypothetical protein
MAAKVKKVKHRMFVDYRVSASVDSSVSEQPVQIPCILSLSAVVQFIPNELVPRDFTNFFFCMGTFV